MADDGRREIWQTLEPSTFRGIPWFIDSITVSGGRKATAKPIVNSSEQVVNDVGLKQRVYKVRGFITATYVRASANAAEDRDELNEAIEARRVREEKTGVLEDGPINLGQNVGNIQADYREMRLILTTAFELSGSGTLVHPVEGEIRNLICTEFSIDETMTEVGIGRVLATFIRETTTPIPEPEKGANQEVQGFIDAANEAADTQLKGEWAITTALGNAYEFSVDKLTQAYEIGLVVAESVETVTDAMDSFQRQIAGATAAVFGVVSDAISVADSIKGVFSSINGLFALPGAAFQALQNGFDFGDVKLDFDFSTPSGKQKKANERALNAAVQCRYLAEAYEAALDLEYVTTADVVLVEEILEAQHRKIVDGDEANDCTKDALTLLRESFFGFLGTAKLNARSIVEEDVTTMTPRVLSYMLYESDEDTETLVGLNDVVAYQTVSGAVTVLSE